MDSNTTIASLPWYRSLNREQWGVLIASNLGWHRQLGICRLSEGAMG